jgi:hypothetical protein
MARAQYILRAYDKPVADKMGGCQWINPTIIFIGVPVATLTRHINVYTMMIIERWCPRALLPALRRAEPPLLITYFVVFSIGEALWSARFLNTASNRSARAHRPTWASRISLVTGQGTMDFSGIMLAKYVRRRHPTQNPFRNLVVLRLYQMMSPIGLWLVKWVMGAHSAKDLSRRTANWERSSPVEACDHHEQHRDG